MFIGQAVSKPKEDTNFMLKITNPVHELADPIDKKVFLIAFSRNFHNPRSSAPHQDTLYTSSLVKESWHSNAPNTAYLRAVCRGIPFSRLFPPLYVHLSVA